MGLIWNAHLGQARDRRAAEDLLELIGTDPDGIKVMAPKLRHHVIKLAGVPGEAARALKEAMLEMGAEAAVHHEVYFGEPQSTDVVLMGSREQFMVLARELPGGGDGLDLLARDLLTLLERIDRESFEVPLPGGQMLHLGGKPLMMGILNCTPDSFYDGGRYFDRGAAVARGRELLADGAAILDVGGESTRPGSDPVSVDEEISRVIPVIEELVSTGAVISIDTQKAVVAKRAVEAGASMVNDVSSLADPEMAGVVASTGAALVLMHMLGTPRTMQADPRYRDLFGDIIAYLSERMDRAMKAGVRAESIIVDPGIGFGKTVAHNLELVRDLWRFRSLGAPILLGPSNKSFVGKVLGVESDQRAEGTAASLVAGVLSGAHILRVHDCAYHRRFVDMAWAIRRGERWIEEEDRR